MEDIKEKIFSILLNHSHGNRTTAAEELADLFKREAKKSKVGDIEYGVDKWDGWYAWFRIGVQRFRLQDVTDKEHAEWYVKMLQIAFTNLTRQEGTKPDEWSSERIIGRVKGRFKELEEKQHDWRSFYNGWLEGRSDMLQQINGIGHYKPREGGNSPLDSERADSIRQDNGRDLNGPCSDEQ